MKIAKTIFFCASIFFSHHLVSQNVFNKVVEIHTNIGISNDFAPLGEYTSFSLNENIIMEQKSFASVRSFGISLGKFISDNYGFRFTLGQQEYGFDYKGRTSISNTIVTDSYRVNYIDFSFEVLNRIWLSETLKLLVNVGLHLNTDPSPRSRTINIGNKDSASASFETGIEYPMFSNSFFVIAGLQFRLSLKRYNHKRMLDNKYKPYLIGLKIGINYQF